jgi:WD40 repeat protein
MKQSMYAMLLWTFFTSISIHAAQAEKQTSANLQTATLWLHEKIASSLQNKLPVAQLQNIITGYLIPWYPINFDEDIQPAHNYDQPFLWPRVYSIDNQYVAYLLNCPEIAKRNEKGKFTTIDTLLPHKNLVSSDSSKYYTNITLAFSPDNQHVAESSTSCIQYVEVTPVSSTALAYPDTKRVFTYHLDIWKKNNNTFQRIDSLITSECIHVLNFSPDGRYVVSGSDKGTIIVWKKDQENRFIEKQKFSHPKNMSAKIILFSDDCNYLMVSFANELHPDEIKIFSKDEQQIFKETKTLSFNLEKPAPQAGYSYPPAQPTIRDTVQALACSLDNKYLAISFSECIKIIRVHDGQSIQQLPQGADNMIFFMASRIILHSNDSITIWENVIDNPKKIITLNDYTIDNPNKLIKGNPLRMFRK